MSEAESIDYDKSEIVDVKTYDGRYYELKNVKMTKENLIGYDKGGNVREIKRTDIEYLKLKLKKKAQKGRTTGTIILIAASVLMSVLLVGLLIGKYSDPWVD